MTSNDDAEGSSAPLRLSSLRRARSYYSGLLVPHPSSSLSRQRSMSFRATGAAADSHTATARRRTAAGPLADALPQLLGGVTFSSLPIEALLALVLSINVRALIGSGADALVKVAVKKAVTLTAALILALIIDCAIPFLASRGYEVELELRGQFRQAVGIISGWVGAQAEEPLGWKLERRIADWLWPSLTLPRPSSNKTEASTAPHAPLMSGVVVS